MRKSTVILTLILLTNMTFSQEKPKAPKDTVIWVSKAEVLRYIESQEKEMNDAKLKLEGQRQLLGIMPDSVQVKRKVQ